ncbi:YceI family protein [uncultured Cytophaga sp.]|uniref:YceI family protein n=1 Tax=uncultured Cytophaga sp. TaxID=160238 RepID=UPI00262B0E49|nr:YceI family protein [uncultured Cytophaga sp.]
MKNRNCIYIAILFLITGFTTQAQIFISTTGKTSFFSSARLENIDATSKKTNVVLSTTTNDVLVKVLISSFVFNNGLMQEHFNETYLESAKYPYAQFKGKINEEISFTVNGVYPVTVTGSVLIHGVEIIRTIPGTVTVDKNTITLETDFIVPAAKHKIDIPKDKISNISPDITVHVNAVCIPYVKK